MPLNLFGRSSTSLVRAQIQPPQIDIDDESISSTQSPIDWSTQTNILLTELRESVDKIDCLVKKCNIAWSVESGSFLGKNKVPSGKSCLLMRFDSADELEMVELLRRTAEIVVQGEQQSAYADNMYSEQIFQYFCEVKLLGKIVDLLHGDIFEANIEECTMLPPLSIATQGVQSVAILFLNMTKDTSLYIMLANERLKDLIDLPFDLYNTYNGSNEGELNELSTNFVSFLKSLSMRINSATLQFFLSYPDESSAQTTVSCPNFSADSEYSDSFIAKAPIPQVEFPLYTKILNFCSNEQDSFVRTTAMNSCLNILRLATLRPDNDNIREYGDDSSAKFQYLCARDRIIISNHICSPARVMALVNPISKRITQLCGWLEDSITAYESIAVYHPTNLRSKVQDIIVDLQEEFDILDDLLKVGIVSLNEQGIEILLATAIYPVLLQPLLYQKKRNGREDSPDSSIDPNILQRRKLAAHPFSSDSISTLLSSSGLIDVNDSAGQLASAVLPTPAKTAILGLIQLFKSMSHQVFVRLIGCCLLHPLTAVSKSDGFEVTPEIIETSREELDIRQDRFLPTINGFILYDFGRFLKTDAEESQDAGETSVYVLSPALADLLDKNFENVNVRSNPYRKVFLNGLRGIFTEEGIQPFCALLLKEAMRTLGESFATITYAEIDHALKNEEDLTFSHDLYNLPHIQNQSLIYEEAIPREILDSCPSTLIDVVESLCMSVITAPALIKGVWKLCFDDVACKTLLSLIQENSSVRDYAVFILKRRLGIAAAYVCQIPSLYVSNLYLTSQDGKEMEEHRMEERINIFVDSLFGESNIDENKSLLDSLSFKNTEEGPRFSIQIYGDEGNDRAVRLACGELFTLKVFEKDTESKAIVLTCATLSVVALLQLDSLLHWMEVRNDTHVPSFDKDQLVVNLSPSFCNALYHDRGEADVANHHKEGAVVSFVGKTALPCVCEISPSCNALKSSKSFIETNGIRWQSLYMVLLTNRMVLVIPTKLSGGNGKIITSCRLSGLKVERDKQDREVTNSSNPARRLNLTYETLEADTPGLFRCIDSESKPDKLRRSHLELWFEKPSLANYAFDSIYRMIEKSKGKRGKHLREHLVKLAMKS